MSLGSSVLGAVGKYRPSFGRVSSTSGITGNRQRDPNVIQIPGSFFPHANFTDAVWIKLTARELTGLRTNGRGGTLSIGKKGTTFKFLAPEQILESHNHDWAEYESIQSRILQKVMGFKTGVDQLSDVFSNVKTEFKKGGLTTGAAIKSALTRVGNVAVPKYKIDSPLRYTSSQRRNYQLTFLLADSQGGATIEDAVRLLQRYSAPDSQSEIDINFPWVFTVTTEPEGLINMNYAVMESILVTWMHPYIKGKPSRCELTVSLKDMSPLFQQTLINGGIVNVNEPKIDAIDLSKQAAAQKSIPRAANGINYQQAQQAWSAINNARATVDSLRGRTPEQVIRSAINTARSNRGI
jgi:hypothetical protein